MLIGTAGHIDHGKTALVKALTGIDADRLPEEKTRGITLDLGYAHTPDGQLSFVDVPGHERLIHNMLAGATDIDFMLLVVAADDGVMPQTREHLRILDLLGVTRGAVVLTKSDLVDTTRLAEVQSEVRTLLASTGLREAPCLPVSARTGAGITELARHLTHCATQSMCAATTGDFRLAIDRCFTIAGAGTVVTGTVHSGAVSVDDLLVLSPAGVEVRVRALQAHHREVSSAHTGERCALNISGEGLTRAAIARGQWLMHPRLHRPTQRLDIRLVLAQDVTHWTSVHLHIGSGRFGGRLALVEGDMAHAGERVLAQLVIDQPAAVLHGDRFIVRDASQSQTLGGGIVLDPFATARGRRAPERLTRLRILEERPLSRVLSGLLTHAPLGIALDDLALRHNVSQVDLEPSIAAFPNCVRVGTGSATHLFAAPAWAALRTQVLQGLARQHEHESDILGLSRERLRRMVAGGLAPVAFDALLRELLAEGKLAQSGAWLHLPDHRAALSPHEQRLWSRIQPLLDAQPWQPPRVRDLARSLGEPEPIMRTLLKHSARVGLVYPVAHDRYFTRAAIKSLADAAIAVATQRASVSAARFRDAIGTGRKIAIQILEFFDRTGFTRRVKDTHVLRNPNLFDDGSQ